MSSLRDQMQHLADEISKSRRERKSCVVRIAKERTQLRMTVEKQREQTQRELAKQALELNRELAAFNRNNKKAVSQSLRESRQVRTGRARLQRSCLRQASALNRRNVASTLRQHNNERQRVRRKQQRSAVLAHQAVKQSVHRLRTTTCRMTRAWSADRREAKHIWQRLQTNAIASRVQPKLNAAAPAIPAVPALVTNVISLSGLALPPVR